MRDLILNWQMGVNFGWGLAGLNLFAHLANDPELRPIMGLPIEPRQLAGLDPLRQARIAQAIQVSNAYLASLGGGDPTRRIDAVQVDCLGNDFTDHSKYRSGVMIGRTIFETSTMPGAAALLSKYHFLLTASNWNAAMLNAATGRTAHVIHEGVDVSMFCPAPRSGWLDPDRFYIFSPGKIEYRKGQDLVILAFKRFAERHADAILVTAWHSPWPQYAVGFQGRLQSPIALGQNGMLDVMRWVTDNGLDPRQVIDIGQIVNVLMPSVLREMHVVVQASRAEACTCIPVKEAMACGIPVIASLNTGMLDLLTDENCIPLRRQSPVAQIDELGTEGWGESDVDEIVAALELVYQDRARAAAIGVRARQLLIDRGRTWPQHAAAFRQWVLERASP
jgi:glycosyltransferase involved in cell wall biosynthesis